MIEFNRRIIAKTVIVLGFASISHAGDWTEPVEVRYEQTRCVSYRAKQDGPFLVVQATLDPNWHTFAMDNKERAAEKLAGRRSLGIDLPTEISVTQGLEVAGPWFQSPPKDFSKPELRWFSWGFENQALFVARVRRSGDGPARIAIRGQACTETSCKNVDVAISVPLEGTGTDPSYIVVKDLVQVR
jgi:hypothetical protein